MKDISHPNQKPIDLWDLHSFDEELHVELNNNSTLIQNYIKADMEIYNISENCNGHYGPIIRPTNQYAQDYINLKGLFKKLMDKRSIRAFHYTRLTDHEIASIHLDGIYLSTQDFLSERLSKLVKIGYLTSSEAVILYTNSSIHGNQHNARSNKFWMVSNPIPVIDSGVKPLLSYWGGEVTYWNAERFHLSDKLAQIGTPVVIEVCVQLSFTIHSMNAGEAAIATFAKSKGYSDNSDYFDLYTKNPIPSQNILKIHKLGDELFNRIGTTYP